MQSIKKCGFCMHIIALMLRGLLQVLLEMDLQILAKLANIFCHTLECTRYKQRIFLACHALFGNDALQAATKRDFITHDLENAREFCTRIITPTPQVLLEIDFRRE
ncbi:hypothetical protein BKN38_06560 [Helicobacter sp. CLO-3]|nr:hypothetical protein BA723_02900 [Helicobacter sp. CLO-3]OHU82714.1 hypothetical protein BKN38_06560 [Helicobacter sp. CLO-3]